MNRSLLAGSLALLALVPAALFAQAKVEVVAGGLSNPCGVAVQPDTGVVFISDSATGRVVRVVNGKLETVIKGSGKDIYGKGPMYDIGPLGLVFLDKNTLVVGDGGYVDGSEYLRSYTVPADGKVLDYEQDALSKAGPLTGTDEIKPEGNLYGLAATKAAVYVTCNGDDTKGWVAKAAINGSKLGKLERSIATKEQVEVDAPVGIAISPRGEIVIGQMGEINKPKDGLLTFYSAKDGKKLLNLETGLYDITGLAYDPKTGLLYATDFAWMAPEEAGLFRLDQQAKDGQTTLNAVKIAALDKPTALAFAPDGTLYVTVIGSAKPGDTAPAGQLLKVSLGK